MPSIADDVCIADPSEVWLPVVGWEGLYEVSDQGRVKSIAREVAFGSQKRIAPSCILRPGVGTHGELFVHLTNGGRRKLFRVHVLVLEAFIGHCPDGMEGCHWDDDKTHNQLSNLRWDSHTANMRDMVRNGHSRQVAKRACPSGHEYSPENTKLNKSGHRFCRECHRIDARAKYWADIDNQRAVKREAKRRSRMRHSELVTS